MLTQLTYLAGQTPFSLIIMLQSAFAADEALTQQALASKSCVYTCILLHCDCIQYGSGIGMLVASNQEQQHQA